MGVYDSPNGFDTLNTDKWALDQKQTEALNRSLDAALSAEVPPYQPPQPAPERRSALGEVWSQAKAGVFVDAPRMFGQAMKAVSSPGNTLYEKGKSLVEDTNAIASLPEMQPSAASDETVTGALAKGARMIPQSVVPAVGAGLVLSGAGDVYSIRSFSGIVNQAKIFQFACSSCGSQAGS